MSDCVSAVDALVRVEALEREVEELRERVSTLEGELRGVSEWMDAYPDTHYAIHAGANQ